MKDYFNTYEFTEAKKKIETDPYESKVRLEKYINDYPKDYHAYTYLAGVLVYINKIEEAQKVIDYVEKISQLNSGFNKNESRVKRFKRDIGFIRLRILGYSGKYSEAYDFCKSHQVELQDLSILNYEFYLRKQLNKVKNGRISTSYVFNQMVEYSEEEFLNHIKIHTADYNAAEENPNTNIFFSNVNILKIFEEVKKYIPSDKRFFSGFYEDLYIFRYDRCGKEKSKIADFIKVYTFHDTADFITMVPAAYLDNIPYVDLNYLVEEPDNKNIKRLSQIDKFNRRFNQNKN